MQASKRPTVTISEYVLRSIWSINFAKLIRIDENKMGRLLKKVKKIMDR